MDEFGGMRDVQLIGFTSTINPLAGADDSEQYEHFLGAGPGSQTYQKQ